MLSYVAAIVIIVFAVQWWRRWQRGKRARFIRHYAFPPGLLKKLSEKHPALDQKQLALVGEGLRQFFLAHAQSGKFVSMPSRVVDDLWHEFILYTKAYQAFCSKAFGRFMHHTPAVVLGRQHQNNQGLRRTWLYVCRQEDVDPVKPSRLPLLFALDTQLGIANGFAYRPQCDKLHTSASGTTVYCGGELGSSASDSGSDGTGGNDSSGNDSDSGSSSGDSGCGGGGDGD